ncbi:hypothetical protein FRB97_001726 [Tulasnella sp. 331]|nr:hypothetical protein FRB97_001726 [Tulasnella sp. 331]
MIDGPIDEMGSPPSSLVDLKRRIIALIVKRRRHSNTLVPFHQLPNEIITSIFLLAVAHPCVERFPNIHILAQVSAIWVELVKSSPLLWAVAASRDSPSILSQALKRSKNAPLHVSKASNENNHPNFMRHVIPHVHRWSSLHLHEVDNAVYNLLEPLSAPTLEKLEIFNSMGDYEVPLTRFIGGAHKLRQISLHSCVLSWDLTMFSGLRVLELGYLYKSAPTVNQLVEILRASPGLWVLTLESFSAPVHEPVKSSLTGGSAPVELLSLTKFTAFHLPSWYTRRILFSIRLSNCSSIRIACQATDRGGTEVFTASTTHLHRSIQAIAAFYTEFKISLRDSWLEVSTPDGAGVYLGLTKPSMTTYNWVVQAFSQSPSSPLTAHLDISPWSAIVGARPFLLNHDIAIRSVCVRGAITPDAADTFVRCLAEPATVDGTSHWPLPYMEELDFQQGSLHCHNYLIEALQGRYGRNGINAGGSNLPARLTRLTVLGASEQPIDSLRTMLGPGVLERVLPSERPKRVGGGWWR